MLMLIKLAYYFYFNFANTTLTLTVSVVNTLLVFKPQYISKYIKNKFSTVNGSVNDRCFCYESTHGVFR